MELGKTLVEELGKDNILRTVSLGIQKQSDEKILKRPLLNLELFLRIRVLVDHCGEVINASVKLNLSLLDRFGLGEAELWEAARKNMEGAFGIYTLPECLDLPEGFPPDSFPFYICTTKNRSYGAVSLGFPEVFKDFCLRRNLDALTLIPSSTDELLVWFEETPSPKELARMVAEINTSIVDPVMQLDPVIYRYELSKNAISIAAVV